MNPEATDHPEPPARRTPRAFLLAMLAGVALVIGLRVATPIHLGYDQALQIQAAQHLAAGQGMTIYLSDAADLSAPLTLQRLVFWPGGLSALLAGLLAVGLPVALAVKCYGALCSLAGWLGLSWFAWQCLGLPGAHSKSWRLAVCVLAFALPVFLTPDWDGSDIFLWAGVPWFLLGLGWPGWTKPGRAKLYLGAGLLCGVCLLMRYASVVLAGYAGLVILVQTGGRPRALLQGWLAFGLALAAVLMIQVLLLRTGPAAAAAQTPGGLNARPTPATVVAKLKRAVNQLPVAGYSLIAWAPERVVRLLTHQNRGRAMIGVLAAASVLLLSGLVIKAVGHSTVGEAARDPVVLAAGFLPCIPAFLWCCSGFGDHPLDYVGDRRYYLPLIPLASVLVCRLAWSGTGQFGGLRRLVWVGGRLYLAAFAGVLVLSLAGLFLPGAHGEVLRRAVWGGGARQHFPGLGLAYTANPARQFALLQMAADPKALLLTNFEEWFFAESAVDRTRIHPIKACELMTGRRISGPGRVLILARDNGGPEAELTWIGADGRAHGFDCLRPPTPLKLLRRFPEQGAKVLELVLLPGQVAEFK